MNKPEKKAEDAGKNKQKSIAAGKFWNESESELSHTYTGVLAHKVAECCCLDTAVFSM